MFDCHPGDVWACVADIGWIAGHTQVVYGPLSIGGTSVLFESIPVYPDPGEIQLYSRVITSMAVFWLLMYIMHAAVPTELV